MKQLALSIDGEYIYHKVKWTTASEPTLRAPNDLSRIEPHSPSTMIRYTNALQLLAPALLVDFAAAAPPSRVQDDYRDVTGEVKPLAWVTYTSMFISAKRKRILIRRLAANHPHSRSWRMAHYYPSADWHTAMRNMSTRRTVYLGDDQREAGLEVCWGYEVKRSARACSRSGEIK